MMTMNNQYSAASLYDGGWRAEDRDQLIDEYNLTAEEADDLCRELAEVEEEATAKEFEDYGKLKYINPEAFYEEGWSIAGQVEDEDGDASDIVLSADKTEYRYTNI